MASVILMGDCISTSKKSFDDFFSILDRLLLIIHWECFLHYIREGNTNKVQLIFHIIFSKEYIS